MRLAEWVREALLAAPVEPVAGSGVDSGEVALGEILALRSLLLNLHFRAAKGEPVAESEMRGLIERADGTKIERARERMAAVRAAGLDTVRATEPEPETAAETEPDDMVNQEKRIVILSAAKNPAGAAKPSCDVCVQVDSSPRSE